MFHLKLFGGASIEADGIPLGGTVAQRRRLALLALLEGSAGGMSRDRLAAYLFPEADATRARGALSDAVHAVRKALGKDALVAIGDELRLDPGVVSSDVAEFEAAVTAGDLSRAVSIYRGPFLDGFFVADAPELERWVTARRERLARAYAETLNTLARQCETAGDHTGQVRWLQALAAHDPFDSRVAVRLMLALEAAGDAGGVLQLARTHQLLLREELGVEPPAEIDAIASRVKAGGQRRQLEPTALTPPTRSVTEEAAAPAPEQPASAPPALQPPALQPRAPRRRLAIAAVSGIAILATVLALAMRDGREHQRTAIAVLPFRNLTAGSADAFFAAGLQSEVQTQLTKVAALHVIGESSTMAYARDAAPLARIARELGVGSVVEGSVQVSGDRLRVNVRLVDAESGAQLWAERYDRTLEDAFDVQSDVAQRIVIAVGAALKDDERRAMAKAPTANPQAYQLYLQGRSYMARPGSLRQNYDAAQQLFERAVALDTGFALARAELSAMHGWTYWSGHDRSPARLAKQREEAEAALRLAPDLPQARHAMGLMYYHGHRDYRRALRELQAAARGLPNDADLLTSVGALHRRLGNWTEAIATYEQVLRLDPRSARALYALGQTYEVTRRYADAAAMFDRALSLAPDYHAAALARGHLYLRWQGTSDTLRAAVARVPRDVEMGQFGSGIGSHLELLHVERQADSMLALLAAYRRPVIEEQVSLRPASLFAAWAHQLKGDRVEARVAFDSARAILDSVRKERRDDWWVRASLGLALAGLGRRDEALGEARWLQQSTEYRTDAYEGTNVAMHRARILAQAGDADAAFDEIERLLTKPSWLSVNVLRLDPLFDPVRQHPRYEAVVAKHGGR